MYKFRKKEEIQSYLSCDKCSKEIIKGVRLPIGEIRVHDSADSHSDTVYIDLCENCLIDFIIEYKINIKLKDFIKMKENVIVN